MLNNLYTGYSSSSHSIQLKLKLNQLKKLKKSIKTNTIDKVLKVLSFKYLYLFGGLINLYMLATLHLFDPYPTNNFIAYCFFYYTVIVQPILLGKYIFHPFFWLLRLVRQPIWAQVTIYWLFGNFAMFVPGYFNTKTDLPLYSIVFVWFLFWMLVFCLYRTKDITKPVIKSIESIKRAKTELIILGVVVLINFIFHMIWASNMEFTSFATDNYQNIHISNIFRLNKRFGIVAKGMSPQYTQLDYTTALVTNFGTALYYIDYRDILNIMHPFEIIVSSLTLVFRYLFFKNIGLSKINAAITSLLSIVVHFSGLYMAGTMYNQQVLVLNFPLIIYFIYKKNLLHAFLVYFSLIPYHITMSVFVTGYSALAFYFFIVLKVRKLGFLSKPSFWEKFLLVIFVAILIILEAKYTFETNYWLLEFWIKIFATKPQFINTIGIYSNISIIQIIINSIGPFLTALVVTAPIAWLFVKDHFKRWVFSMITFQILIIAIPFPVAARTMAFFAIPFSLAVFYTIEFLVTKRKIIQTIILAFGVISYFAWTATGRSLDLGITGNYWKLPFASRDYQNFLKSVDDNLDARNIKPEDYKVVTEYFTKQHFESIAFKYDDNGVYEEDLVERNLNYDFLNNYQTHPCKHHQRKYILYILNERVYKWANLPKTLARNSAFAIWWSEPLTEIQRNYIRQHQVKHDGLLIYDKTYNDYQRSVLIQCF